MALAKGIAVGVVAAVAIPWVLADGEGQLSEWTRQGLLRFDAAGTEIPWSWPLFCVVTLFAWGFLAWSER
jgi:hypothetical protein